MDINKTPKGTLFRLFRETFITTSEPFYSHYRGITMIKAHNITTGEDTEIGEVAMYGAHPIQSPYKERCKRAATAYLNDINSLECMNFCNDKAYWARINAGALQVEVADMLAETNKPQDTNMTLTEIAQTFPPMHQWSREQQQTVANAIQAIIGQTFVCNHPNMQGVETTVVAPHPHSGGYTMHLYSPSRETHQTHECDVFHFVEFYTPQEK